MYKPRKVTIVDVAEAAGVSHATVSRVLNNRGYIGEATRQKVLDAVDRLGYVANVQARSLAGGASLLVGMVVPSFYDTYLGRLSQSIDLELARLNYRLAVFPTHRNQEAELEYINRVISGLVDGVLLVLPGHLDDYLDTLKRQQFPYVLIDSVAVDAESFVIGTDNWQGAYDATRYLLELGHRRIGHLKGRERRRSAEERFEGYRAALADFDVLFDPDLVSNGGYNRNQGYKAALEILTLPNPPTAVFAANDASAFGAIDAARELNITIPDQLSLMGFDDVPEADLVFPKLSTVYTSIDQMGRTAARMLVTRIKDSSLAPRTVLTSTSLIIRDSTAALE